jgi:hypothetical protein
MENEDKIIEAVAEAMRETYGKWLNEGPLTPFHDSDKRGVWLLIAQAGIDAYEKAKGP